MIISLIYSLNNGLEGYLMIDEGDISNFIGVNLKKNSDRTFELYQLYLIEKIINHFGLTLSANLNERLQTTLYT